MENPNVTERKKRALSLIQPTGVPTLGNYLGALRNWVEMEQEFDCIFGVADLHAITVRQEPAKLRHQILETFALLMAIGLDAERRACCLCSRRCRHIRSSAGCFPAVRSSVSFPA